jgi:hypothetical protein
MSEENTLGVKTLLNRWFNEIWGKGRIELADEMCTPDVEWNDFLEPGISRVGLEKYHADYKLVREAIHELKLSYLDVIGDDLRSAFQVRVEGILRGGQLGVAPTNKRVVLHCVGLVWHEERTFKIKRAINCLSWEGLDAGSLKAAQ